MSEERDIDALNKELSQLQIEMDLLKRKREALLILGHSICSPHAIIGYLFITEEEPPTNQLSNKYMIKINVFDLLQDIGKLGIVYNIKISTKSAHVIKIIRETFIQEGHDSLSDETIDDALRMSWTTNWDNYCRIRHVDIDD